jgi:uncharacterized protein YbdZ (MbtH family)
MFSISARNGLLLFGGAWTVLDLGASQQVTAIVLLPHALQHHHQNQQQQQQQQQEEGESLQPAGLDMPGQWQVVASAAVKLSRDRLSNISLYSSALAQQLEPLAADHFLLAAHHSQVGERGWRVACCLPLCGRNMRLCVHTVHVQTASGWSPVHNATSRLPCQLC